MTLRSLLTGTCPVGPGLPVFAEPGNGVLLLPHVAAQRLGVCRAVPTAETGVKRSYFVIEIFEHQDSPSASRNGVPGTFAVRFVVNI